MYLNFSGFESMGSVGFYSVTALTKKVKFLGASACFDFGELPHFMFILYMVFRKAIDGDLQGYMSSYLFATKVDTVNNLFSFRCCNER